MARTNWAGNLTYRARNFAAPATVAEVREIVQAVGKVRVVGSRHCFNDIADTPDTQISLEHMRNVVALDRERRQVTVEGGIRYGDLGPWLHERGFALANLASLPHISVAGATATATHGSGTKVGNLATAVAAIEFVNGDGELATLSRKDDAEFPGAVVNLGALGVVTSLTLDVVPAFEVRQDLFLDLAAADLVADFDAIMGSGYSVSLFTPWTEDRIQQVWVKNVAGDFTPPPALARATRAPKKMHPILHIDPIHCTEQLGVAGPSYDRLPHFRMGFVPASGEELQVEYFVPYERASEVVAAMFGVGEKLKPLLMISELRTVAADDLWLSGSYRRKTIALHFSFQRDEPALRKLLPVLEEAIAPFDPRPHWGKVFTMAPDIVRHRYEKMSNFRDLIVEHDMAGRFRNEYIERMIFG
ncbi:MAG: FAD-binding protein [Rhizobiales bacterium]|nr:FAD-binding protein [Hyphomicrobiales bacterium]